MSIDITLWQGDCLEQMASIPDGSVDMVLTDPPYMINVKSTGSGMQSYWADCSNAAVWYAQWMQQTRRILKPTGCLWSCLNWRSFTAIQKASNDIRWPIESVLVWDKCCIGTGGLRGLRPCYELVALWAMPDFKIANRSLRDVQAFKWSSNRPHGHPAEKPVELMQWLIEQSSAPKAVILDPFMGSGTTGEACANTNRDFIGMELAINYFEIAKQRIECAATLD